MTKTLSISLAVKTIPVPLDLGNGSFQQCELREMSAGDRDKYLQQLEPRLERKDGKATVKNIDGLQAELVGRCLYRDGSLVPFEEIQKWRGEAVQQLFDAAQELNQLSGKVDDDAKKA